MSESLELNASKRGKRACTNCRQQKARCDAYLHPSRQCSRCRKMNAPCVISDPFKRQHKREKMSQLEQEAETLRRRLGITSQSPSTITSRSAADPGPVNVATTLWPDTVPNKVVDTPTGQDSSALGKIASSATALLPDAHINGPTIAQRLGDIQVESETINDIFQSYFLEYDQFIPILDCTMSPNAYFAISPFLFWAVIGVACRSYPKDHSLLDRLSPKIIDLAMSSIKSKPNTIHDIKALLLVISWSFTPTSLTMDVTHRLSGTMLHMAMQMGLHQLMASQELSGLRTQAHDVNIKERGEMWGHCVVVYQLSCNAMGHAPGLINMGACGVRQSAVASQRISSSLRLQMKLNGIVSTCCTALIENGIQVLSADQERSMGILLRVFESQLKDLQDEACTGNSAYQKLTKSILTMYLDLEKYYFATSQLTVQVFHFHRNLSDVHITTFVNLFNTALTVLQHVDGWDRTQWPAKPPLHVCYSVLLATHVLLRLWKGPMSAYLDARKAEAAFHLGLEISKRHSNEKNDTFSKNALILTQLWSSDKISQKSNDAEFTSLRVRSHLAMSCVFDHILRWKKEFEPMFSLVPSQRLEAAADGITGSYPTGGEPSSLQNPANLSSETSLDFLDDQLLSDFGWNMDDAFLLAPDNSYGPVA